MPKLYITVDSHFKTKPLLVNDEKTCEDVFLTGEKAREFFSKIPVEELTFEVVSTNEGAQASFPFSQKNGKKGSVFTIELIDAGESIEAKVTGEFSVELRAGVVNVLKLAGDNVDFRIRGIMWKGGAYNGFMASVADGDLDQASDNWAQTFPKILSYSIK